MAKVIDIDDDELRKWLESRPQNIRDMVAKCPPGRLYRMKSSRHRVTIAAYSEDGTVRVDVTGKYNVVAHERSVFGVSIDDLEECDLPGPDEPVMAMLNQDEVKQAIASGNTKEERINAVREAADKKLKELIGQLERESEQ